MCRCQIKGPSPGAIRLRRAFHRRSSATKHSSRSLVAALTGTGVSVPEDHRARPVHQHAPLQQPAQGSCKNLALDIAADTDKIIRGVRMTDAFHVLFDNGPSSRSAVTK